MKLKVFIIPLFLLVLGCSKIRIIYPCTDEDIKYYIPQTYLSDWFNKIVDSPSTSKNYESKSSDGLSETIKISKIESWREFITCGDKYYFNNHYQYYPKLYNNNFSIYLGFKHTKFPISYYWFDGTIKVDTTILNFEVNTSVFNDFDSKEYFIHLVQELKPNYSTKIKAYYRNYDYTIRDSMQCDTCIQSVGIYNQNGITYNEVYKYINPLNYGNENTIKEILIDKKYGVIQYTNKKNVFWSISPFK